MVDPYDEPNIGVDDTIIRRIDPEQHGAWDDDRKCNRISSKAFKSSSIPPYGMSVDVLALMQAAGVNPREFVTTPKFRGSVAFTAGSLRSAGLLVGYDPLEATVDCEANPYHGEVWGNPRPDRFTKPQERAMMNSCEWFVEIEGWAIVRA